jgi:ribosomal protein S18 acetylase RimI-like enzyme
LVLDTMVIQEPAQAFYRKQGYTETRRDLSRSPAVVFFAKEL